MPTPDPTIEAIELPLLLEAIVQRYGYDFRDYQRASLKRGLRRVMDAEGVRTLSALQDRVLHNPQAMASLLSVVSINVSAMFRDPAAYRSFRERVVPSLRDLPLIRIWHAGCAGGEEVHSLAILLHEEGLLPRTRFYATDINERALTQGKEAIYPISRMREYTTNYQEAGGTQPFSDYYTAKHESAVLRDVGRANMVWAVHNLATDGSFNEFHVIACRNVLIYFNKSLQDRVHRLIYDSLSLGGVLWLGSAETLRSTPYGGRYDAVSTADKLYRKSR